MTINTFSAIQKNVSRQLLPILLGVLIASPVAQAQTASIAPLPTALTEANLNTSSLVITLAAESFIDAALPVDSFDLVGEPAGTTIGSVTWNSATQATIALDFNYTDFDSDQSISVNIRAGELTVTASGALSSSGVTVTALQESASINDPGLDEAALDGQTVIVTLTEETFVNPGSMGSANFTLNGAPAGLSVIGFDGTPTSTQATLDLQFTPGDFDVDYNSFSVTINQSVLTQSNADLTTNVRSITARAESATLTTTPDPLTESSLNGSVLYITLTDEAFTTTGSVDPGYFDLDNEPVGYTISSATLTSSVAVLQMAFSGPDFDVDITNFRVGIDPDILRSSSAFLYTNTVTINADIEVPTATLTSDVTDLDEDNLDGRTLYINLSQETFSDPGSLVIADFALQNYPPGLSIVSVSGTASLATLVVAFDGTDFDVTYLDFHVLIDPSVLTQSTTSLASSSLPITAVLEPEITGVSIPNDTMNIGDIVPVTITVVDDQGDSYGLEPGAVIGGKSLTLWSRVDNTTYTATFEVTEGGSTYEAYEDIPVSIQISNGSILGDLYTDPIVQDSDLLDPSRPEIQFVHTNTAGPQNIGSVILLWIHTDGTGYTFDPTSTVNGIPITDPSITIQPNGTRYDLRYTVNEGDNNVSTGELALNITPYDAAGNMGTPVTSILANTISIDASRPDILQAYISSTPLTYGVGEILDIVVRADQTGYRNHEDTWINGVPVGPDIAFSDLGAGLYQYSYTVRSDHGAVSEGALAINIVLQDGNPFSNISTAFTDLDENNVVIYTDIPSATVTGSTEICQGETADITITLSGTAPWDILVSDGTTTTPYTTSQATFVLTVQPDVTSIYTVERVEDATGNDNVGAGNATITVHPLPDVRILNLQGIYDVKGSSVLLDYTPSGGVFSGPGISGPPWIFDPSEADTINSPHLISYVASNQYGCTNADTVIVEVVGDAAFINLEKEVACSGDSTLLITGYNISGTPGSFDIEPTPPIGAFTDYGNDTAILRPTVYVLNENLDLTVKYTFWDSTGTEFIIPRSLTIEYLEDADIYEPPSLEFCQNVSPYELSGNYNGMEGYRFSGSGVVEDSSGYYFDPGIAPLGQHRILYEYVSDNQCRVSDSVQFTVNFAPVASFRIEEPCVPAEGGQIQFENLSDTGTSQSVVWLWKFDIPSPLPKDRSDEMNPSHQYDTGHYVVSLDVITDNCNDQAIDTIHVLAKPKAAFSMSSSCQSDTIPVVMTGKEVVQLTDTIVYWGWKVDSAGTEIFSSDTSGSVLSYTFAADTTYTIGYKVISNAGCSDLAEKEVNLSKTYMLSPDNPYAESFEFDGHGWSAMANTAQNSWSADIILSEFPENAANGIRAWYTNLPDPVTPEDSWVLSPCFNFEKLDRPMVSLDIKRSLHLDKDGAVLQYTVDNEETWHNVGDVDDGGKTWYNSTSITPSVGGGKTGWTGEAQPSEDEQWYRSAHGLDELIGDSTVRFRVAFGTLGGTRTDTYNGFAFDNLTIRQRTRLSVLEYFTNANTPLCAETDSVIMEIMNEVAADVIDIQYHAAGSLADRFYNENGVPANSRGTYYSSTGIPYAVLDGNIETYDFSSIAHTPNIEDIRLRSLEDPDFKLAITVNQYKPLEFIVEMQALRDLDQKERILYAVVLQRKVVDPLYAGTNGMTVFRHVARKMIPDAGGTYQGSKSWSKGETDWVELAFDTSLFPLMKDSIIIAVFMQDYDSKEILQAATNPQYVVSTFDQIEPPSQVLIYPNPARELVNVYFEESPTEEMFFTLYDLSGKRVITDVIEPWQQLFTRSLGDLEQGMYIIEIRNSDRKQVLYRDKLLHY